MPILHFTGRARNRLRLYHLREDDVAEAFANPDFFVDDTPERHHLWRRRGDRWLKVSFVEGARVVTIITVATFEAGPAELQEASGGQGLPNRPPPAGPQA